MDTNQYPVHGAGLGLRRSIAGPLADQTSFEIDFMEVAPENWIGVGGSYGKQVPRRHQTLSFKLHGLSLSICEPTPLSEIFLHKLKQFMPEHTIRSYNKHLSFCIV